ncbi:Cytochrome c oxidase biogenesis protein Cmc1 like [Trypanosoma brucei equiperdum]|uniref:COX assembly mitochondrial protein n=1 Tax=Trypanosoma brucei equiperdum TaxID=630700 RepID=A0A3L6L3R9_9TRYP|nr:Cytochrome c oxidase biogenesis protein Cmc1 like [Trypanosoma brucei equiperdum]
MGTTASTDSADSPFSVRSVDSSGGGGWRQEDPERFRKYMHLKSQADQWRQRHGHTPGATRGELTKNLIEEVYEEDFESVDHVQSMRLPPMVLKEMKDAVANEAERRCAETEKVMARCLQDKMWTSWKCQKERDALYQCVADRKEDNELLMAYRWKYNLGTFRGELIGRNNMMRRIWKEHFPDRDLPHPWVKDA